MLNLIRNLKKNKDDKETYEEFCKVYLENIKESQKKTLLFNSKYFTRKNFRIVVLEQTGSSNIIQYDSFSNNSSLKEISSPNHHSNNFFNVNINKNLYDTVFGHSGMMMNDNPFKSKIHFLRQEGQMLFTLIYPSYSHILKRIRSLSHSPSLSRSSSLGDYASLNSLHVLNELSAVAATIGGGGSGSLSGGGQAGVGGGVGGGCVGDGVPSGGVSVMGGGQRRVAICVAWSFNLDDEAHIRLIFRYILHVFQLLSMLAEKVAQIHQDQNGGLCADRMLRARNWFVEAIRAQFTAARLPLPVWPTFVLLQRHTWFRSANSLPQMRSAFFLRLVAHLLGKFHCKEKDFVLAKLITAILTYHQGWIHGVNSSVMQRHMRTFSNQPGICRLYEPRPNSLCSQLGSAILGCGGISIARTLLCGSHNHLIHLLLYFASFWIRFCPLTIRQEDSPDPSGQLSDPKKTTRRKSASCTDSAEVGPLPVTCSVAPVAGCGMGGSQEDLRHMMLGGGAARDRGSSGSGVHLLGLGGPSSTAGGFYQQSRSSTASTGGSPIREHHLTDQQIKQIYTQQQLFSVEMAANEFYLKNRQQQQRLAGDSDSAAGGSNNALSSGTTSGSSMVVLAKELPLLFGGCLKLEDDILYRSQAHFSLNGYTDHVVPGAALQGCSEPLSQLVSGGGGGVAGGSLAPETGLAEELRLWLRHTFWMLQAPRRADMDLTLVDHCFGEAGLCERPLSATAVIMNSDKCSVQLFTVTPDPRHEPVSRELESPSPLVMSMLDQLHALLTQSSSDSVGGPDTAELAGHLIDCQLTHIHRLSLGLADAIREMRHSTDFAFDTFTPDPHRLASNINCHVDDLPLLYSTALSHSPDIYLQDGSLLS